MQRILSDPNKEKELGPIRSLISPDAPKIEFSMKEQSWRKVQEVIRSTRSASAPGSNRVPYKVYKQIFFFNYGGY